MSRSSYIKALKALVVLSALAFAGLRVGWWTFGSSPPQSDKLPARAPIDLADLKRALDTEFAPVVADGLLKPSTGCGVAIGVIDHGERRLFTYGAARADSIFQIGSITKTFTGLALAQLAAQGKVRLDDPIRPILFPDPAAGAAGTEITLLDLATHRSGLPSVPENLDPKDVSNPFADYDRVALHSYLASHGTAKPADGKYLYSSFGIALLGYTLAQRTGVPYAQLIKTEITTPLRMDHTAFALSPDQEQRLIQGHDGSLNPLDAGNGDSGMFEAAVGAKSTAGDLLTYLDANLHPERYAAGAAPGSSAATLPDAIAIDHQPRGAVDQNAQVAFSWLYDVKSGRFVHGGTTPGFTVHVEFSPTEDRGIVVLYNRMDEIPEHERFVDRVAENIDELMSGKPAARIDTISENDPALADLNGND
jgi:serine-type D-Ala-D-Ala carboxypeptidase/endopeptidase